MNKFPYTNFHDVNLDWIIKSIRDFSGKINSFAKTLATFVSVPPGGSTGEALVKKSNASYDIEWDTIQAGVTSVDGKTGDVAVLPVAGATGQALVKRSAANYDVEWDTISGASAYYATYGVTNAADIYAEYSADKIVLCEYQGYIYTLFNSSPTLAHFSYINENISRVLQVTGSSWNYTSKTLAIENDVHDIPQGGTAGQALTKIDSQDYNVQWSTISGGGAVDSVDGKTGAVTVLPTGGTADQVLAKVDGTNYNVYWKTISGGGGTAELYWCTYGTTTATQVTNAISNNMLPVMLYNDNIFICQYATNLPNYRFSSMVYTSGNQIKIYYTTLYSDNTWDLVYSNTIMKQPSSASNGQFLMYNGTNWVPSNLPLYSGGVNP